MLTPDHISLLQRGLTFCPTPGEPSMEELRRDLDNFHRSVKLKSHFGKKLNKSEAWSTQLNIPSRRTSDPNITTSSGIASSQSGSPQIPSHSRATLGAFGHEKFCPKSVWLPDNYPVMIDAMVAGNELNLANTSLTAPLCQNLTMGEKRAMNELKNNPNIILKKADKGSSVVILSREEYLEEGYRQLSDTKFYQKQSEDLTHIHNKKVEMLAKSMLDKNEINSNTYKYMVVEKPRTAQFYLLPKIHKTYINRRDDPLSQPMIVPQSGFQKLPIFS